MAMKVRYNVLNGEIVSEQRNGVKSFYVPDATGSTIAITDSAGTITDRVSYWPYGEVAGRTGSTPTPFLFVGTRGYFADGSIRAYIRARYYALTLGCWQTVDPNPHLSVRGTFYWYGNNNPVKYIDPTGLFGWVEIVVIGVVVLVGVLIIGDMKPDPVIWDTGNNSTDDFKCTPMSNFGKWLSKNKTLETTWCRSCVHKCYMHFGMEVGTAMTDGNYNIYGPNDIGWICYQRYAACMKLLDGTTF